MSYQGITRLINDAGFIERLSACLIQESTVFKNDGRLDIAHLALAILRNTPGMQLTFVNMAAAAPGFIQAAEQEGGEVDSSLITDGAILANVQANYPTVASIFYNSDGSLRP